MLKKFEKLRFLVWGEGLDEFGKVHFGSILEFFVMMNNIKNLTSRKPFLRTEPKKNGFQRVVA